MLNRSEKRDTVRITTKETYGIGSVWIFEALHTPYGVSGSCLRRFTVLHTDFARRAKQCSVWP